MMGRVVGVRDALRARGLVGALAALGVLTCAHPVASTAQVEIYAQGNQLYQAGSFAEAVDAYEAVVGTGTESADLYYNLGNAYFKTGALGRSILNWERALVLSPGDADVRANLDLARSLIADDVRPLPRFWLLSVVSWWVHLVPRGLLVLIVGGAWIGVAGGLTGRVLARRDGGRRAGGWVAIIGAAVLVVFGTNLAARELGIGVPERGVVMLEQVAVRSAPSNDDDLILFQVHEGTRVRIDQRTDAWAEIVLDDGKVGWVPAGVMEVI